MHAGHSRKAHRQQSESGGGRVRERARQKAENGMKAYDSSKVTVIAIANGNSNSNGHSHSNSDSMSSHDGMV